MHPVEAVNPSKKIVGIREHIESEVEEVTAGDPCGGLKWLRRNSLRGLKAKLAALGMLLSHVSIRRILKEANYSLKANQKSVSLAQHPQRNQQFCYIRRVKKLFIQAGHPVISVDTKKKELIGNYKNDGQNWTQAAEAVKDHDFPDKTTIKAVPYGIYDVVHNQGFVYVGTSGDTAEFAVDAIVRWFERKDRPTFKNERKLLILCDGGNGSRVQNWKRQLQQQLAERFGLEVMVCHYPPGTSKWNPIEHRLFSFVSLNWAGQPLLSLSRMTALIRGTVTTMCLQVKAAVLKGNYPLKIKVSNAEMAELALTRRKICPQWNYGIHPRSSNSSKQ